MAKAKKQTDETVQPEAPAAVDPELSIQDQPVQAMETAPEDGAPAPQSGRFGRLKQLTNSYWAKKKLTIPATVVVIILLLLAIPVTRYASLGLFIKRNVSVTLRDSTTNTPISSAAVTIGGHAMYTNGDGKVTTKVKLGAQTLTLSKQYYKTATQHLTVTFSNAHNTVNYRLVANGRQVPVSVMNQVTGKPIVGAEIVVTSPNAVASKTDKNGTATLVLPAQATSFEASVTAAGYNALTTSIQVTAQDVAANHFKLVSSGKIYFLSNQSGKIDVVKTNLDGSQRQTVLAGSGNEDPYSTSLLASRDWKYLALLAKRDSDTASVYLIDTSNDKLTTIDEGNANFALIGWSGDTFNYQVNRTGVQNWQPNAQALKSYNALSGKLTTLDQTAGEGTSQYDYGYQNFSSVYIINDSLIYAKNWYSSYYSNHLNGKSISIVSTKSDGSSRKTVKDFPIPDNMTYYTVYLQPYEPAGIYIRVPSPSDNSSTFYEYENGAVTAKSDVSESTFNQGYPTFLLSPSGKQTFWSDQRDGKNALFVGDDDAKNQKQIANLSEYSPYGWYSDNYLLVTKNSSELYIMSADGSAAPQKISDYYKPPTTYRGYGGGYGGL